jgi:hypothetical protein
MIGSVSCNERKTIWVMGRGVSFLRGFKFVSCRRGVSSSGSGERREIFGDIGVRVQTFKRDTIASVMTNYKEQYCDQ